VHQAAPRCGRGGLGYLGCSASGMLDHLCGAVVHCSVQLGLSANSVDYVGIVCTSELAKALLVNCTLKEVCTALHGVIYGRQYTCGTKFNRSIAEVMSLRGAALFG